jgi:hypothetical protein
LIVRHAQWQEPAQRSLPLDVDRCDWPRRGACLHLHARDWAAFGAPVWGAIVPDIVSKEEPSAVTWESATSLSGIVVLLEGLLLPLLGAVIQSMRHI